jgi:hypothetical protein
MHLKKWQKRCELCICVEEAFFRVMMANRHKVSFWPDGSTGPRNYGFWSLVLHTNMTSMKYGMYHTPVH